MDENLIREMWEASEGTETPDAFMRTVSAYYRSKRALGPVPFDERDFATCAMLYKIALAMTDGKESRKARNG